MKTKARTLHLDQKTHEKLEILASIRSVSKSSFIRTLINERFFTDKLVQSASVSTDAANNNKNA